MWSNQQIQNHKNAAQLLHRIMKLAFDFIKSHKKISEREVQEYIISLFKKFNLKSDGDRPIVAFGKNTANIHYYPQEKSSLLESESLIMIDIWAKTNLPNSPFADITWMGYFGKLPKQKIVEAFKNIKIARNRVIKLIELASLEGYIVSGKLADSAAREFLAAKNLDQYFSHSAGHALGFQSPHGKRGGNLRQKNPKPLEKLIGYTIEPGLYFKDNFGVRTEINFYIDQNNKVVITTKVQNNLLIID